MQINQFRADSVGRLFRFAGLESMYGWLRNAKLSREIGFTHLVPREYFFDDFRKVHARILIRNRIVMQYPIVLTLVSRCAA